FVYAGVDRTFHSPELGHQLEPARMGDHPVSGQAVGNGSERGAGRKNDPRGLGRGGAGGEGGSSGKGGKSGSQFERFSAGSAGQQSHHSASAPSAFFAFSALSALFRRASRKCCSITAAA